MFSLFFLLLFVCLVSYLRIHCLAKVQKFTTTLSSEFYSFSTYISDFDPFWVNFLYIMWGRNPGSFFHMWILTWPRTICWKGCWQFLVPSHSGLSLVTSSRTDMRWAVFGDISTITTLQGFTCDDLFSFNDINLDPLIEIYGIP